MENNQKNLKEKTINGLAIVGFAVVITVGLWSGVQVIKLAPNALSAAAVTLSAVFTPSERLEVSLPSFNLNAGEQFDLSWEHIGKRADEGSYTISYSCRDGFSFTTPTQNGTYTQTFCETPFNFLHAQDSVRLVPVSINNRFLDIPVVVAFTPVDSDEPSAQTEVLITVINEAITDSSSSLGGGDDDTTPTDDGEDDTTTTPTYPTPTTGGGTPTAGEETSTTFLFSGGGTASNPNGQVDLSVNVLATGVVDKTTGEFTAKDPVGLNERAAVRFEIVNLGTKTAEGWSFNAPLPSFPFYIFHSDTQAPLGPGDRIEFTIGFDKIDPESDGTAKAVINVDPTGTINEVTEANNIVEAILNVTS